MTPDALAALQAACSRKGLRRTATLLGYSHSTVSLVLRGLYPHSTTRLEATVRDRLTTDLAATSADWLQALRADARRTTQAQAAARVGISEATCSQVLAGTYRASTARIERRVRGELLGAQCECPVMGDVSTRVCQEVQERKPPIANPQHARCFHACRGRGPFTKAGPCPHFNGAGNAPAAPSKTEE